MNSFPSSGSAPKATKKANISFVIFMLALTGLFAYLGNWQMHRLAQKEAMLSAVAQRINLPPIGLPPLDEWVGFDAETYNFRPLKVTGTFDHSKTIRVFTSLVDANGPYSGPGYWVVAPLMLDQGGIVFVNRGFIPEDSAARFETGGAGPTGEVTIEGIGRASEKTNSFTPGADFENKIEWVRNIDRLSEFMPDNTLPVAPIYIDEISTQTGALPQGGETKLTIVNRHFEYALTWFSLALLTPIMLVFWWWRSSRQTNS